MFDLLTLENSEDYFKLMYMRKKKGVFFNRYIGYDDEKLLFYRKFQLAAEKKGVYIKKNINNPTEDQVNSFFQAVGDLQFSLDENYLLKTINLWLTRQNIEKRKLFSEALYKRLKELSNQGTNLNILKNAYVKFMCWGKYIFENVLNNIGEEEVPKILYEGEITKYELYMLYILAQSGCDIVYLNFLNEESYLKVDKLSEFSKAIYGKNKGIPKKHFSEIDIVKQEQMKHIQKNRNTLKDILITNSWLKETVFDVLFQTSAQRGMPTSNKIYNLFALYIGLDEKQIYSNRLFELKEKIEKSKKPFVIITNKIGNPSLEEVKKIKRISYTDKKNLIENIAAEICVSQSCVLNTFVQNAFIQVMESHKEDAPAQLYNYGMKLLCWLNRYADSLFQKFPQEDIPIFFYYGNCSSAEAEFLYMLANMPLDILLISPDKNVEEVFQKLNLSRYYLKEELPESMEVFEFPSSFVKVRAATIAYSAQRQLDTLLYDGTGLFRNRQFTRSHPITLKTTYDEISILWKEEAKYRPSFQAEDGMVVVPNIFAKVCGIENRDINGYFRRIETMLTEKTIFIKKIPYITKETVEPYVCKFISNGKLLPEVIKKYKDYPYDFLSEDIQDYMLEKMQQLIDLKWIQSDRLDIEIIIVSTILNLDKTTLRLIQQFDFTGEIPKLIVVDVDESMFSLKDCIYILFLNLVGFDIIVFTPTGYRNLEKYISREAYELHEVGEYVYNLAIPNLRVQKNPTPINGSNNLFSRLFGKGRI